MSFTPDPRAPKAKNSSLMFRPTEEMYRRVSESSNLHGVSKSEFVRQAVEYALNEMTPAGQQTIAGKT